MHGRKEKEMEEIIHDSAQREKNVENTEDTRPIQ